MKADWRTGRREGERVGEERWRDRREAAPSAMPEGQVTVAQLPLQRWNLDSCQQVVIEGRGGTDFKN